MQWVARSILGSNLGFGAYGCLKIMDVGCSEYEIIMKCWKFILNVSQNFELN